MNRFLLRRAFSRTSAARLPPFKAAPITTLDVSSALSRSHSTATSSYQQSVDIFPSLLIGPDRSIQPQGSFAEAQARFLDPDSEAVESLRQALLDTNMGIVAHYYMDVELQGILQALQATPGMQRRIGIADSLKMGDQAVTMCQQDGVESVICLGVDFMAESVQAILQKNGFQDVPVYRATSRAIGCSLAESAEGELYRAWLQQESARSREQGQPSLHVIYINTSLETKAVSSSLVPTITCTSSNVLQTILQASSQMDHNLRILYGPDTYMGQNLQTLLSVLLESPDWTDERIQAELHPDHSKDSLRTLRDNLSVFPQGNCVVHHMFGAEVVTTVREHYYDDCYVTAHLEVPGEMFQVAMEKSLNDEGVVGSTADILNFIARKVQDAANESASTQRRLRFILGTEAGMVTAVVQAVQDILEATSSSVEAEIIFPVSNSAVMSTQGDEDAPLPLVPGASGHEGCSTAGGCATCPFMKMNDVDRVFDIVAMVQESKSSTESQSGAILEPGQPAGTLPSLKSFLPPNRLYGQTINGQDATDLGTEAILYMRSFMLSKALPSDLTEKISATLR
eukprot:Nitzschia sp. Nitz4//scaffold237_size30108//18276//20050//NITZ4_007993-RA/size30108-augustus-gene-0.1-mRNA-1//-1//CDS//3329543509//3041//frame0